MKTVRLSAHVNPERYKLVVKPDLEKFIFTGEETIYISIGKPVKEITLHAKELEVSNVRLKSGKTELRIGGRNIKYSVSDETITFVLPRPISKKAELSLSFKGILNDKMRGFYRSRYIHNGKEKHLATTQFEATDARKAFPCFDEPAKKAIFDVTMIIPESMTAISNTIDTETKPDKDGNKIVKFAPSPKMSTYLVAFIAGNFESVQARTKDNVLVRVFVTPGKKHQAKFALDTAIKCLEFYNSYFDIPYPLPVLDLIAIPDFNHGAMENWGAVTYREAALLVDPENSSLTTKQRVALVIAHELAHQWFGNLVTMEWWTHLWLNEGFASYIEYLAVDKLFPRWDFWTQFVSDDLAAALRLDSLVNTHPIEVEVRHPDEIGEIFDAVSYSKGSSVIRMLASFLGEKDFRDGLRYYLKKHSYNNAYTEDLWQAFEKVSKKPVRKIMQNWTGKPGYPIVTIKEKKNELLLRQRRFFSSSISKEEYRDNIIWSIPVKIIDSKGKTQSVMFNKKATVIKKSPASWMKFNYGTAGFYRTDYPAQMLQALESPIKKKVITTNDRLNVLSDAFAIARSGDLPTSQVLNLIGAYENETEYTIWIQLLDVMMATRNLIFNENYYPQFEEYCRGILVKIGERVGWDAKPKESESETLLRGIILSHLVSFKDKDTIEHAVRLFRGKKPISADIRPVVYRAVAQSGGEKEHSLFIKRYKEEQLSEEKNRIGRALGQFRQSSLLKKTLQFAMSSDVRSQDTFSLFASCWDNQEGRAITWEFTKKNWRTLVSRYPGSGHMLNYFILPALRFVRKEDAKDIAEFFKSHPAPGTARVIKQTLESIYSNAAWLHRDSKNIEAWLLNNR